MIEVNDSFRHRGLRIRLVKEIEKKGITDKRVLDAIGRVPRHLFMDSSFVHLAYQDQAFPIGQGQTISQPYTVAVQSSLLDVQPGNKVLEVGTGSGYQAAVLSEIEAEVFTIERQKRLHTQTKQLLKDTGYESIRLFLGDGNAGLPAFAPFDRILVTAGAGSVPANLLIQMAIGGIMVIPVGVKSQTMTRIKRLSEDDVEQENFGDFSFVPMLKGIAK
jgi:protein-L-isoaspartate(D-aspartate) O-methyltransferase